MAVKIDKDRYELAKAILEGDGICYEEWINKQHLSIITSNIKVLKEGLVARKELIK